MGLGRVERMGRLARVLLASLVGATLPSAKAAAEAGNRILHDDFGGTGFAAASGLFYKDNAEQRAGRVSFRAGGGPAGKGAVTLSIVPSCRTAVDECSERAEVWERPEVLAGYDETVWYGFSIFMDDPVPQDDGRYVMAQWKREIIPGADGDYSPFLALRLYQGRLGVTVETDMVEAFPIGSAKRPDGCLPGEARVLNRPTARQTRALVAIETGSQPENYPDYFDSCAPGIKVTRHADLPPAQKGWIDVVVRSNPGPSGNGHVEIIADGVRIVTVTGHIGHAGPGLDRNQYFKFGPYRAPNPANWSVSFADFRRGPRCMDVIRAGQCPAD